MTVTSYVLPTSVAEAVGLLGAHGPDLLVLAGGTIAMPLVNEGVTRPTRVMGLRRAGLDGIEPRDGGLRIGATTTLTALAAQDAVPLLATAARRTASWAVRNMATVGGNLFSAPPRRRRRDRAPGPRRGGRGDRPAGTRTIPLDGVLHRPHDDGPRARRARHRDRRPGGAGREHVPQVRPPPREHAGGRDRRRAARDGRRVGHATPGSRSARRDPTRCGSPPPRPRSRAGRWTRRRSSAAAAGRDGRRRAARRRRRERLVSPPDGRRVRPPRARGAGAGRRREGRVDGIERRRVRARRARGGGPRRAAHHPPGRAPDPARPDVGQGRLPPGRLRQLHGPRRRRAGAVVPPPRRGRRRAAA